MCFIVFTLFIRLIAAIHSKTFQQTHPDAMNRPSGTPKVSLWQRFVNGRLNGGPRPGGASRRWHPARFGAILGSIKSL